MHFNTFVHLINAAKDCTPHTTDIFYLFSFYQTYQSLSAFKQFYYLFQDTKFGFNYPVYKYVPMVQHTLILI